MAWPEVNYDLPANILTYVHRVGRTARGGEKGSAYTLVKGKGQEDQFFAMRKQLSPEVLEGSSVIRCRVKRRHVTLAECQNVRSAFERALESLRDVIKAEEQGLLSPLDKIRRLGKNVGRL